MEGLNSLLVSQGLKKWMDESVRCLKSLFYSGDAEYTYLMRVCGARTKLRNLFPRFGAMPLLFSPPFGDKIPTRIHEKLW
jgi:hypothetical protein